MGTLRWLIHTPFLRYAEELPDCSVELTDGADRAEDGSFVFPLEARRSTSGQSATLETRGRVSIRAYEGMLRVDLINPTLELEPGAGRLFTENPYRAGDLVPIADLSDPRLHGPAAADPGCIALGAEGVVSAEARLTSQGAGWLSEGRYPAGLTVAPVTWTTSPSLTGGGGGNPGERTRSVG